MAKRYKKINSLSPRVEELKYLYTKGGEFSLDGVEYVGEFHINGGRPFTGPIPSLTQKELKKVYIYPDHYRYDQLNDFDVEVNNFLDPIPSVYQPSEQSFAVGFDNRFFVEKREDDKSYAVEIDQVQYARIGRGGGIDGGLYHYGFVRWKLTGTIDSITNHNRYQLLLASKQVPSIAYAVPNLIQFGRVTQLSSEYLDQGIIPIVEDLPKVKDVIKAVRNYYSRSQP